MDGDRAGLGDQGRDDVFGTTTPERERGTERLELAIQRAQCAEQIGEPGTAGRPEQYIVEHEEWDDRPLPNGRDERRMVVET